MNEDGSRYSRRDVLQKSALATGAVLFGGTAVSGTAAAGIGDGRVLDYHLNNINYDRDKGEIVSNFVHDASPADNDGEWKGDAQDPVVKDGAVGNAFGFDGDSEVVVPSDSTLNPAKEVTVAGWAKATGDPSANYDNKGVAGKWNSSAGGAQYVLWTNTGGSLEYTFSVKTTNGRADAHATAVSDNNWHHIAGVFDGTASLYLDGQKMTGSSASGDIHSSGVPFKVGNYATGKNFLGKIDEVRVYDRALSDPEITELYEMRD